MEDPKVISNWMKREVISVRPEATVLQATALILEKRVGTLPVVDDAGILVGVASITDIIKIFLPDFLSFMDDIDFVKDYGILEASSSEDRERAKRLRVADIMEQPVSVEDSSGLVHALSVMEKHNLRDLPVVRKGKLVGIASQVDIGCAFLTAYARETGPLRQ